MASSSSEPSSAPPLAMGLRLNLSIMMFLQFAIWGSWFIYWWPFLESKGFKEPIQYFGNQTGLIFANMALGAVLSTMFAGFIADRLMSSEKLMAICHLLGAVLLVAMAKIDSTTEFMGLNGFTLMMAASLAYALLYNPTLSLSNSIAFTHVPDGQRDFPGLRVLGTIGWIVVGLVVDVATEGKGASSPVPLYVAAGLSVTLGFLSFFLPHTPPKSKSGDTIPFLKALSLFKSYSFAVFFIVSFVITIVLAFYFSNTSSFLGKGGMERENASSLMAIGQGVELVLLPFLPIFLRAFGMKMVLVIGMAAWGVRYLLFSQGYALQSNGVDFFPLTMVIIGIALHGVCFDFFFAAGFIHVNNEAPDDIKASGQALFSFLTYGLGMWLGGIFSGIVIEQYKQKYPDGSSVLHWDGFWLVPSLGVFAALAVFILLFRSPMKKT